MTKQDEAGVWPASSCFFASICDGDLTREPESVPQRASRIYFFLSNKWQRLQRTRAFTKQLHFGQRFNFRSILRFVRGRITISSHSCQFRPMSGGKERHKLAKGPTNLKQPSEFAPLLQSRKDT